MADNNNYCACTGDEAQYTIKLNQQGPTGPMGPQGNDGQDGISPQVLVATNTPNEYTLRVITAFTSFVTPNLMANADEAIEDLDEKLTAQITALQTSVANKANLNLDNINVPNPFTLNGLKIQTLDNGTVYLNNQGTNIVIGSSLSTAMRVGTHSITVNTNGVNIDDIITTTASGKATIGGHEIATIDEIPEIIDSVYIKTQKSTSNNTVSLTPFNLAKLDEENTFTKDIKVTSITSNSDSAPKIWQYNNTSNNAIIGDTVGLNNLQLMASGNINLFSATGTINTIKMDTGTPSVSEVIDTGNLKANLPIASTTQAGIIKVGENLTITADGTLNAQAGGAELTNPLIFATEEGTISSTETWINNYGLKLVYTKPTNPMDTTKPNVAAFVEAQVLDNGTVVSSTTSQINLLTAANLVAGENITLDKTTSAGNVIISATGGGGTVNEKYGIEGDYATHYGILDCPNGLIDYNATGKDITLNQGVVLQLAGQETKTTIATAITSTLTSSTNITLFYAGGELLEVGKIDYSLTEPTDNGVDNYQAWYNPTVGKWQLKSNDTGNVWREVVGTPIANIYLNSSNITRIDYIGYRILDDDILVQQSEIETLNETITTLTNTINSLESRLAALEANINGGTA